MKSAKEEADYWLFSNESIPQLSRNRDEVSLDMLNDVTDEEAQAICAEIRERLENGQFDTLYVQALMFFHDRSALDILGKWEKHFVEKQRVGKPLGKCNCIIEIHLLKSAIKQLKKVKP